MTRLTPAERRLQLLSLAVLDTVKEIPEGAPSGIIYMGLMAWGVSIGEYQAVVNTLQQAGSIEVRHDCLFYVAPKGQA